MQTILSGLFLGAFIFLVAAGFCWVRESLGFYNMAHGEFVAVGAYAFLFFSGRLGHPLPAALCAVVLAGLVGMVVERAFFRPLRQTSADALLLTSFGVAILIRAAVTLLFSSASRGLGVPDPALGTESVRVFSSELVASLAALGICGVLVWLGRTRFGLAANAMGESVPWLVAHRVPLDSVVRRLFFAAAALGGLAGILVSWRFTVQANFFSYMLYAFVVSVASRGSFVKALGASGALGLLLAASGRFWSSPLAAEAFSTLALMVLFGGFSSGRGALAVRPERA